MDSYDVVVIGGGAAGLSGAVTLGRARRSVLVVDAGSPRNAPADGVHGFLTRDGMPPGELIAVGREEVARFGGEVRDGEVVGVTRGVGGFEVALAGGTSVGARRLLVTTGLVDELPDVAGVRERWGADVVHCPYCHGWEIRGQAIGILGSSPRAVHQALLFRQWSDDVVLFRHEAPALTEKEAEQLDARGITVVGGRVAGVEIEDDRLRGLRLDDGTLVPRDVVAVQTHMVARGALLAGLGLQPAPHPSGAGDFIPADVTGQTDVPGVWVAGNVTDLMAQVVTAASSGVLAAAQINADLVAEDTERAEADQRAQLGPGFWDRFYGDKPQVWSGNPNPQLVDRATDLVPGTALDVGCGEGADGLWLAGRGWQVTGVDVSTVALERAAAQAAAAGLTDRTTWREDWEAGERYDLVTAHFVHLPRGAREALHRRLAAAVRPGGTLLLVGHHPSDHRGRPVGYYFTPEEVVADLDPEAWELLVAASPAREVTGHGGGTRTMHDTVVHARRIR